MLDRDPKHAKVLQQLGWLHHQQSNSYTSQDQAIEYLEQSVSSGMYLRHDTPGHTHDYIQTTPMRKAGTCLVAATWRNKSFQKPTKPINKRSIEMAGIRHSGVQSVCSTIKSTSTETHLMHTPGRSVSIPSFPRSGTTLAHW